MLMRLLLQRTMYFFLQARPKRITYVMYIKKNFKIALFLSQDLFKVAYSFRAFFTL